MKQPDGFDFWYAVNNTEVVLAPKRHLETFGHTLLHYHLVSELMDEVDKVRVRTGRMQSLRPQLITPQAYSKMILEGFGQEASRYADWLREQEENVHILRYGYTLKQEAYSEETVSDSLETVLDRVTAGVKQSSDAFAAVIKGVDEPWDVCLVKLFWTIVQRSAQANILEMAQHRMFEVKDGLPYRVRQEIETAFDAAAKDAALIKPLGKLLQKHEVFARFEERFFALVRSHARS